MDTASTSTRASQRGTLLLKTLPSCIAVATSSSPPGGGGSRGGF
jgi:hypothetical protein